MSNLQKITPLIGKNVAKRGLALTLVLILFSNLQGRAIQKSFSEYIYVIPWFIVAVIAALIFLLCRKLKPKFFLLNRKQQAEILRALFFCFLYCVSLLILVNHVARFPIEKIHFLKYGVLGFFCFFSLTNKSTLPRAMLALAISGLIGVSDESLQYFVPERFFDLWDILYNLLGSLGGVSLALISEYLFWKIDSEENITS
jgi:glycopeptide antibiotics resistance protein